MLSLGVNPFLIVPSLEDDIRGPATSLQDSEPAMRYAQSLPKLHPKLDNNSTARPDERVPIRFLPSSPIDPQENQESHKHIHPNDLQLPLTSSTSRSSTPTPS